MSKRYFETEMWSEDWILEMTHDERLFWVFLIARCDHAGIWKPNWTYPKNVLGLKVSAETFLERINFVETGRPPRILILKNGRWYLTRFISFQYGSTLKTNNNTHRSVLNLLTLNDAPMGPEFGFEVIYFNEKNNSGAPQPLPRGSSAPAQGLPSPRAGAKDKDKDIKREGRGGRETLAPTQGQEIPSEAEVKSFFKKLNSGFKKHAATNPKGPRQ